jgi:hypothetical protein
MKAGFSVWACLQYRYRPCRLEFPKATIWREKVAPPNPPRQGRGALQLPPEFAAQAAICCVM